MMYISEKMQMLWKENCYNEDEKQFPFKGQKLNHAIDLFKNIYIYFF